jgi:hypothetical protein
VSPWRVTEPTTATYRNNHRPTRIENGMSYAKHRRGQRSAPSSGSVARLMPVSAWYTVRSCPFVKPSGW